MLCAMRRAQGTIHVFTFKEGLLSAVAHDLRFRLERFEIVLDGDQVRAELDLKALSVEGPMEKGELLANAYDTSKRADVEKAMHREVLQTEKYPKALFSGNAIEDAGGHRVAGQLELAGHQAPLSFVVKNEAGIYRAEFEIQPSQWKISPYKALLGAIKLKDRVVVQLALTEA